MDNNVSIKLMGGLGNYLFQIAVAYAYGLDFKKNLILTTDDSVKVHNHLLTYKSNILSNVNMVNNINGINYKIYNEPEFNYNELPEISGNVYLNGYFQSDKYFLKYEKEIRHLFKFPEEYVKTIKNKYIDLFNKKTCSLHVRRGDYLSKPEYHPTQSVSYYEEAIKHIEGEFRLVIFSDDIEWCKLNLNHLNNDIVFITGNPDYEDLILMSLCDDNIICNSTFSWWGAWLNNNDNKVVVIPENWFGPAYSNYNTNDLYCKNWIKI